jgi:hypothetical protein
MPSNLERKARRKRQIRLTFDPVNRSSSPASLPPAKARYEIPGKKQRSTPVSSFVGLVNDSESEDMLSSVKKDHKLSFKPLPTPAKSSQPQVKIDMSIGTFIFNCSRTISTYLLYCFEHKLSNYFSNAKTWCLQTASKTPKMTPSHLIVPDKLEALPTSYAVQTHRILSTAKLELASTTHTFHPMFLQQKLAQRLSQRRKPGGLIPRLRRHLPKLRLSSLIATMTKAS